MVAVSALLSTTAEGAEGGKSGSDASMYDKAYVVIDRLNEGLPRTSNTDTPDLQTPQSSLENFLHSCRDGNYERAARSLNLNGIPTERQAAVGADLARKLKFVMDRKVWFQWEEIPDRPDGKAPKTEVSATKSGGPKVGPPRRGIEVGSVQVEGRDLALLLLRVKPGDAAPVWVFSRQSVENIPLLYKEFGPSPLESRLPDWLKEHRVLKLAPWQWIGLVLCLLVGIAIGWGVQKLAERMLRDAPSHWALTFAQSIRGPVAVTLGLILFYGLASNLLQLAGPIMLAFEPLVIVLIIMGIAWFAQRTIDFASRRITQRYEGMEGGEAHAILTRVKVAKHVLSVLVVLIGAGWALSQFEWAATLGYSLLASAGVAGVVLGVAAQRPLANLFAGIHLAATQPVRVGDAVIFEGEFGWIEEVAVTYLIIRTWDLRRLVVPTTYFMERPVQNWTKGGENMMKPVYLYADYRVDVPAVRKELEKVLKNHPDYDETVPPILQVTSCTEDTVEIRACAAPGTPRPPGTSIVTSASRS